MKIEQILEHLANISYVPFTCYEADRDICHFPELAYLPKLTSLIHAHAYPLNKDVICTLTEELLCIGFIKLRQQDRLVIMGPISSIPCDNRRAQQILRKYSLLSKETSDLLSYFSNTPKYSLLKFANLLIFANYVLNNKAIEIMDLLPDEYHFADQRDPLPVERSAASEHDFIHDSQAFEKKLFSLVRLGKSRELDEMFNSAPYTGNLGVLSDDMLRNQKNLIICSIAMASRAAVDGGLDYETAMRRADAYLQKVEMAPDIQSVQALTMNMLKTFTAMVAKRRIGNPESATAFRIYNYVEQHINSKIREQDIADALGISRPYLCTQFKRETGMNLNDFINKAKIDEACALMTTTKQSISEIASKLEFSSQSYFQAVFKKVTGTTPKKFKEKAGF